MKIKKNVSSVCKNDLGEGVKKNSVRKNFYTFFLMQNLKMIKKRKNHVRSQTEI
jgi:hypothetical protein